MTRVTLICAACALALGCEGTAPATVMDASGAQDGGGRACANDRECDDGLFCSGGERCMPADPSADARGCVPGTPPCSGACDEAGDRCGGECEDADGDGSTSAACGGDDCDDTNPLRAPSHPEVCDDANLDEDCDPLTFGSRDADGDGYVDMRCCNGAICGDDCDDAEPGRHPDLGESCNLVGDDDCDPATRPFDDDDDGYDDAACGGDDCNDADARIHPDAPDVCEGLSTDCVEPGDDSDGDGHLALGEACTGGARDGRPRDDCEDLVFGIHGAATETCDGRDQDCDWVIDEGVSGCVSPPDPDGWAGSVAMCLCSMGRACCLGDSLACVAPTDMCPDAMDRRFACDGGEDCPTGQVCCGDTAGSECVASCPAERVVCNDHLDCPDGVPCGRGEVIPPFTYGFSRCGAS